MRKYSVALPAHLQVSGCRGDRLAFLGNIKFQHEMTEFVMESEGTEESHFDSRSHSNPQFPKPQGLRRQKMFLELCEV